MNDPSPKKDKRGRRLAPPFAAITQTPRVTASMGVIGSGEVFDKLREDSSLE